MLRYAPLIRLEEFKLRNPATDVLNFVTNPVVAFSQVSYSRINSLQDLWPSTDDLQ